MRKMYEGLSRRGVDSAALLRAQNLNVIYCFQFNTMCQVKRRLFLSPTCLLSYYY